MRILYYVITSMCFSFCIGIMLNARIKISVIAAITAGVCYGLFVFCNSSKLGYFLSTLILALLSELIAKKVKTPSTVFLIIGVYTLVPGPGIYNTIRHIIENDYEQAIRIGGETFVNIALMATAIALISIVFGKTSEERFKKHRISQLELFHGEKFGST